MWWWRWCTTGDGGGEYDGECGGFGGVQLVMVVVNVVVNVEVNMVVVVVV